MNSLKSIFTSHRPLSWRMALGCLGLATLTGLAFIFRQGGATLILGLAGVAGCFFTAIAFLNDLRFWVRNSNRPRGQGIYLALTPFIGTLAVAMIFYGMLITALSAEVRSWVGRCRADMRTVTIALETYRLDHHAYPAWSTNRAVNAFGGLTDTSGTLSKQPTFTMRHETQLVTLTTPFAYITSHFADNFAEVKGATFCYWATHATSQTKQGYILWSPGPDGIYDLTIDNVAKAYNQGSSIPSPIIVNLTYDPSNGTGSRGDVYRYKQ